MGKIKEKSDSQVMNTETVEANAVTKEPVNETTDKQIEQNGKTKRDKNYKKGDKDDKGEKKKGKYGRNRYEEWEKEIEVTLDTEIPELPKEKLAEPNNDDLRQK